MFKKRDTPPIPEELKSLILDESHFDETNKIPIGGGTFGTVYRLIYKEKDCVVKEENRNNGVCSKGFTKEALFLHQVSFAIFFIGARALVDSKLFYSGKNIHLLGILLDQQTHKIFGIKVACNQSNYTHLFL